MYAFPAIGCTGNHVWASPAKRQDCLWKWTGKDSKTGKQGCPEMEQPNSEVPCVGALPDGLGGCLRWRRVLVVGMRLLAQAGDVLGRWAFV